MESLKLRIPILQISNQSFKKRMESLKLKILRLRISNKSLKMCQNALNLFKKTLMKRYLIKTRKKKDKQLKIHNNNPRLLMKHKKRTRPKKKDLAKQIRKLVLLIPKLQSLKSQKVLLLLINLHMSHSAKVFLSSLFRFLEVCARKWLEKIGSFLNLKYPIWEDMKV